MKAVLCRETGSPDLLSVEDIPPPELEDDEVRIRVRACGVNFPDVLMVAGKYQVKPPMPFSPGAELSGDVVETGARCGNVSVGQRVLATCGYGGMAEQICVPGRSVVPIPPGTEYETAAGFLLAYGTSYHALKQRARLRAGETLLVLGAAGGVGLAAVELGRLMGARVIAAASSAEKLELASRHGADHLVNYSESGLKEAVAELTSGRGADVIYDPVGGDLNDQCLRSIAWNGRLLVIGFASGTIPKIAANLPLLKGSSVVGVFWGRFTKEQPGQHRQNTAELVAWLDEGRIRPHISKVFPLEQAAGALMMLAGRQATGKIVIRVP